MTGISLAWHEHPPQEWTRGAITIGNFDGVHRGHRALIETTKRYASQDNRPCVVITFDPPPLSILNPSAVKPPLSTYAEKERECLRAGADVVVTLRADAALLALSPEAFFEDVIVRQFKATSIVEGIDFRFGRKREGDILLLESFCKAAGIRSEFVPPVEWQGETVSSSRVRNCLLTGDVRTAAELLTRPYAISGRVVEGAKRGRTIGFPTANLADVVTLLPGVGVYGCRAILDGRLWPVAVNIGPNPTFGEEERKIEAHVIGYAGDLYDQTLTLEFVDRVRDTRPFGSVDELVKRLHEDVDAVKIMSKI